MKEHLIIRNSIELRCIASDMIFYVEADGSFSKLYLTNGDFIHVTQHLGIVAMSMGRQLPHTGKDFVRVGRNLIINLSYLYYINLKEQYLELLDGNLDRKRLKASITALKDLMDKIEKEVGRIVDDSESTCLKETSM